MSQSEYWDKFMHRRLSRRAVLKGGALAGAGLLGAAAVGCGGSNPPSSTPTSAAAVTKPAGTTATTPTAAAANIKKGGTYTFATELDPRGLDPHIETWPSTLYMWSNIGSHLLRFTADNTKIVPDLAEKWEQPDANTYIFSLRKGVKWHNKPPVNGRECTAEDVKYSIERQMTPDPGKFTHGYLFKERLEKIDVVDKNTIKFVTKEPYAPFINFMANNWTLVVPKEAVEKYGDLQKPEAAIGTGPFILDTYTRNVEMVLKRNKDYWDKNKPYVDEIVTRYIPDFAGRAAAVRAKEVDLTDILPTEVDNVKKSNPDIIIHRGPSLFGNIIRTMPDREPFTKKQVRQAVQAATNPKEYIDSWRNGWGEPMGAGIPARSKPWGLPETEWPKFDIEKAKKLMAEAGVPNGFKTTMLTRTSLAEPAQIAKSQLGKIGIDVELKVMETAQYYNLAYKYDYDMAFHTILGADDPDEYLASYYGRNSTYYRHKNASINDRLFDKIDEQSKIVDPEKRKNLVWEIQRIVNDEAPVTFVYLDFFPIAQHPWVKGYQPPLNYYWTFADEVWIDKK